MQDLIKKLAAARLALKTRNVALFKFHYELALKDLQQQTEVDVTPAQRAALRDVDTARRLFDAEMSVARYVDYLSACQEPLKALDYIRNSRPCGLDDSIFLNGVQSRLAAKCAHVTGTFDDYRRFYARPAILHDFIKSARNDLALERFGALKPKSVLCVGPNNAALEQALLTLDHAVSVTVAELASDFSEIASPIAEAHPGRFIVHQMQDTYDWGVGAYDLVLCFEVLEHVPKAESAAAALSYYTGPGGTCLVSVPNGPRAYDETIPNAERFEHVRAFSAKTLEALLRRHFDSVSVTEADDDTLVAECRGVA